MLDGTETTFISPKSGVIDVCLIFHGFRFNDVRLWYWSPHFHVLGVIKGGYGCRNCNHERGDCRSCSGFNGREVRGFEKDGYIVKVMGERKTVFGTAWYQLNHSTIRTNVQRPHACTWFGVCSYRRLKVTVEKRKHICKICQYELKPLDYHGSKSFVTDRNLPYFERDSLEDLMEDGVVVWVARERREYVKAEYYGSGSYGE
jgi:hypothetical protein